jgi:hypothetical protein
MSIKQCRRHVYGIFTLALILSMSTGCGHKDDAGQKTSAFKPGVAAYPPNMQLGPDGKPVRKAAQ